MGPEANTVYGFLAMRPYIYIYASPPKEPMFLSPGVTPYDFVMCQRQML